MLEESSQVASGLPAVCCVGRADLVVSWLMFYVTLIQPINNLQHYYPGWTGGQTEPEPGPRVSILTFPRARSCLADSIKYCMQEGLARHQSPLVLIF